MITFSVRDHIAYIRCLVQAEIVPQKYSLIINIIGCGIIFYVGEDRVDELTEDELVDVVS